MAPTRFCADVPMPSRTSTTRAQNEKIHASNATSHSCPALLEQVVCGGARTTAFAGGQSSCGATSARKSFVGTCLSILLQVDTVTPFVTGSVSTLYGIVWHWKSYSYKSINVLF